MTLTVDLTDLSAFTASVKNATVFSTIGEFWKIKQAGSTIQVMMTSQNWNRVNESSYEFSDGQLLRQLLRRQRLFDEDLEQGHIRVVNGALTLKVKSRIALPGSNDDVLEF